ncbi:uncharacterized protein LOC127925911 [Oncorhynchus keta]|uniref:uncharacterized protein LOC127925911 n=1 Tax=Oncorhynchus keta TaxID=8018 RepID=UPI00227D0B88|nr:uncharacterized protein LOC127925911 [Oncorhynchus keta]
MHHVSRVRGLETQLVWAISKETARLSPEGIPYCATKVQSVTWIQYVAGRVTQYASHLRHETSVDGRLAATSRLMSRWCTPLSTRGWMGCSPPRGGRRLPPSLRPPISSSLSQSLRATTAMRSDPLPYHQRVGPWPRLVSLRQAFTTLLGSTLGRNHLFVAGKGLMGALVQAHHMDEVFEFIRAYNDFVDYLSDPPRRLTLRGAG